MRTQKLHEKLPSDAQHRAQAIQTAFGFSCFIDMMSLFYRASHFVWYMSEETSRVSVLSQELDWQFNRLRFFIFSLLPVCRSVSLTKKILAIPRVHGGTFSLWSFPAKMCIERFMKGQCAMKNFTAHSKEAGSKRCLDYTKVCSGCSCVEKAVVQISGGHPACGRDGSCH
eukprot:IDg12028t1